MGPGGRVTIVGLTVRELLRIASSSNAALLPNQIVGGPPWIDSERFDITAIGSDQLSSGRNSSPNRLSAMLWTLINERFKLKTHTEVKQMAIYALVVDRADHRLGSGLRQSSDDCVPPSVAGALVATQLCGFRRVGPNGMSGHGITMELLAGVLADLPDIRRVVRNRTNLTGRFDLDLEFMSMSAIGGNSPTVIGPTPDIGPTIFAALKEEVGLRLDSQRGPVDVLVIDHVEHPTED